MLLLDEVCTVSISTEYTSPTSTQPKPRNSSPTLTWVCKFSTASKTPVENWIKYKPLSFKEMFNQLVKAVSETLCYVLIRLSIFVFYLPKSSHSKNSEHHKETAACFCTPVEGNKTNPNKAEFQWKSTQQTEMNCKAPNKLNKKGIDKLSDCSTMKE